MPGMSRRSFLLGAGAAAALAACSGDDEGSSPTTTGGSGTDAAPGSTAAGEESALVLGAAFDRNALLVTGIPQRAPFLLFERSGGLVSPADVPPELTFELVPESGDALEPIVVATHGADVDRAYWPLVATFPSTGIWTARTDIDGTVLEYQVTVNEAGAVPVPQVGQPMPSAPTPTTADPLGVQTICTAEPPCPLHEVSLSDALAQGRPVALLVSTPAYCQVAICGPVLDLLVDAAPTHGDVALVHLEVYPNGEPSAESLSPVVTETLRMTYEPALFVADAGGLVTARLDNIYDSAELDEALRSATG